MSKQKKKRTKRYKGASTKQAPAQVIRVAAVKRSKPGQWWHEKKKSVLRVMMIAGVILIVILLIREVVRLVAM